MRCLPALLALTSVIVSFLSIGCGAGFDASGDDVRSQASKARPAPRLALPDPGEGCRGARQSHGTTTLPIKVDKVENTVSILVNICVGDRGPFPLLVDTGSAATFISPVLASRLQLEKSGAPGVLRGVGCSSAVQAVKLPGLLLAGVPLPGQTAYAMNVPGMGDRERPQGVLGADVLDRFGAARIDYARETLILIASERKVANEDSRSTRPLPKALVKGKPEITAPMMVVRRNGLVSPRVRISLGDGQAKNWVPDTGAGVSAVDPAVARDAGLERTGDTRELESFCSIVRLPEARSGDWKLAGTAMKPQRIAEPTIPPRVGAVGLLGSSTMSEYGSVVFDWDGGRLLLGTG